MKRIVIIGGGASGLVAAIEAARTDCNAQIFILEQKENIGKKILATGNGRCNLTNRKMEEAFYRSENADFVAAVLGEFGYEDTLEFFESLGLLVKFRGNYVYPRSDQASTVLELLRLELLRLGIQIYTGNQTLELSRTAKGFHIRTQKQTFRADKVILACGGKASPNLGSDGSGYGLAKSMGHTILPVVPALVQLKVHEFPFAKASGVRVDARVVALKDDVPLAEDVGEVQITAYGISGIPVFQISRYIALGLHKKQKMSVMIDFVPERTEEEFLSLLIERISGKEDMAAGDFLIGVFHQKLIPRLLEQAKIRMTTRVGEITYRKWRHFSSLCKKMVLPIEDTNGFENAQVCAGGVCTEEVNPLSLESRYVNGLYLVGELLDVDGICGGYNLQWAWSTGYLAGRDAARRSFVR